MTIKEAIGQLKCNVEGDYINLDDLEAFNLAIPAIEKQIPKKPITDKERMITIYRCGCGTHLATLCDKDVIVGTMQNYCSNCGQALDWSDNE